MGIPQVSHEIPMGDLPHAYRQPIGDLQVSPCDGRDRTLPARGQTNVQKQHEGGAWPELMGIYDAARFLGISKSALYRALDAGQIPVHVYLVGNQKHLARRQLEQWLSAPADNPKADDDVATASNEAIYDALDAMFSPSPSGERGDGRGDRRSGSPTRGRSLRDTGRTR